VIVDGHVRLGTGREVALALDDLLASLDRFGIDGALVAPAEGFIAVSNRAGNEFVAKAARHSGGRLGWYAVANPWYGPAALEELHRAAETGACALALDPALQGFDLLDGLADPLIEFASRARWPVYCRTGTPAHGLPLQLAELAVRFPETNFIMGRNGATDFWLDALPALHRASNLHADTAYAFADLQLDALVADERVGSQRIVFTSDTPYADPGLELETLRDVQATEDEMRRILGGNLLSLVDWAPGRTP